MENTGFALAAVLDWAKVREELARRDAEEDRVADLPRLLRHQTLRVVSALQLATGCGMAAATVYVTLDLQVIRHISTSATGLMLLPMAGG